MKIEDVLKSKDAIANFISHSCKKVDSTEVNPIFPFKITEQVSFPTSLSFCGYQVVDSWLLASESFYTFFILIHPDLKLVENISKEYGERIMESSTDINDGEYTNTSHYWDTDSMEIVMHRFANLCQIKRYKNCVLINIGNMPYRDIVILPHQP